LRVPNNFYYYLSLHKECNESHLIKAKALTALELDSCPHAESVRLKRMVFAVLSEVHRMMAFVRLKANGNRALYGYLKPRHKIGAHICNHFARRNPGIIIALGNGSESWISLFLDGKTLQEHGGGMAETMKRLNLTSDCHDIGQNVDSLWQVYYDSQYCAERKNHVAFRQRMPNREQKAAGQKMVQNKNGCTLDDFMGGKD
jgi:probable DNA metabolism protein